MFMTNLYLIRLSRLLFKPEDLVELFSRKNQTLLIWGNSLLILNLGLDILDGVGRLDLEGNGLTREGFDKNLHPGSLAERLNRFKLILIAYS